MRNIPVSTRVSERGRGGGAPGTGAEIPLQPVVKTMVSQAVPLQPMEWRSMVEQISTCSPWRIPHQSRWMPKGGCDPMESPCWSRLLAGPVDPWREGSPCWSRFAGRTCDPMGDPHWSSLFLKDCNPWKGPLWSSS